MEKDIQAVIENINRNHHVHIFSFIYWSIEEPEEQLADKIMEAIKGKLPDTFYISDFFCGLYDYAGLIFATEKFNSAEARNVAEEFLSVILESEGENKCLI